MPSFRNPSGPARFKIRTAYDTQAILDLPLQLVSVDGLALPPVENVAVRAPMQSGSTHLFSLLLDRVFSVGLNMRRPWGYALDDDFRGARKQLMDVCNPGLGALEFEVLFSSSDIYTLREVFFESGFDVGLETTGSPRHQNIAVRFIARDPAWYGKERSFTIDPVAENTSALPLWDYALPTENFGNWFAYPEITLYGPMTEPTVSLVWYDTTLGAYVAESSIVTVETLAAGGAWRIITDPRERCVIDGGDRNVALSEATSLANFALTYSPIRKLHHQQASVNWYNNFIRIQASGCTADSYMVVTYNDRYVGI